jgi:hypothetical protein
MIDIDRGASDRGSTKICLKSMMTSQKNSYKFGSLSVSRTLMGSIRDWGFPLRNLLEMDMFVDPHFDTAAVIDLCEANHNPTKSKMTHSSMTICSSSASGLGVAELP